MRKADAWQWLDTANYRKSLPAQANAHEWNALYALKPDEFIVTREQFRSLEAEIERLRAVDSDDAAIGALAREHAHPTDFGWQFKAFQVYGAPSLETLEDAAIAQRGGNDA